MFSIMILLIISKINMDLLQQQKKVEIMLSIRQQEILQLIMISRYGDFGMNLVKKWQLKMLSIMLREELIQ